ncbi:MAG: metallophosphoesterase [Symploca sp. SIO2E6]|nr:metallophosphoesterase [Symploca sp. SIO2E6]
MEPAQLQEFLTKIQQLQSIMIEVATGESRIEYEEEEYTELYLEVALQFELLQEEDLYISNPNHFSSLWDWYNYWSSQLDNKWEVRREFIRNLYVRVTKPIEQSLYKQKIQGTSSEEFIQDLKRRLNQQTSAQSPNLNPIQVTIHNLNARQPRDFLNLQENTELQQNLTHKTLLQNADADLSNTSTNTLSTKQTNLPVCLRYILHLSDLHITNYNQATLWSNQLAEDLRNELGIPQLDALIISGDIANYSTSEEYKAAKQFLDNLRQDFPLEPEQIIIVPGNHDLNWKQAKKAYKLYDREDYEGELQEDHYIEESATVIRVREEELYKERFVNFSQFYQAICLQQHFANTGKSYPLDYDQQGILYHLREQNLLILGLNSAWQLDHHYKSRASINMNALSNALTQIRRNRDYDNCLKIAVWHHPLISAYEDRINDSAFLEQLAVAGFRLFLHGHIHEAKTSNYRYDMSQNGRKLDQICAGTFGATIQELVTGTPWQYNLLQLEPDKLTVRTRRRTRENGAWESDSIWRQGRGESSLDYYEIEL